MKQTSPEFLFQVSHLLDTLPVKDAKMEKTINDLQDQLKNMITLSLAGEEHAVHILLNLISPEIEDLVAGGNVTDLPSLKK